MATDQNTGKGAPQYGRKVKGTFLVALCLFLLVNATLSFAPPIQWDEHKFPYKGWSWWVMNDLKTSNRVRNVALLGSSLMCSALGGADSNFLHRNLDLALYHRASYLDHKLSTRFGGTFDTFSLAAPGQMPSDAYLTLRAMVNHANRPDVVIYGVAPRDFIDSTLSCPIDTEPFKYLRRLVNIDEVSGRLFRTPFQKLDWWLQKGIYMYGYATDLQLAFKDKAAEVLGQAVARPWTSRPFTWWDRVKLLPEYLPGEIHDAAMIASPVTEKEAFSTYRDNTSDYLARYRSPDKLTYKTQMFFLKKLMEFCRKERIELILVNMPITLYNACMLQPGIYAKYVQALQQVALENNVAFYDLADFTEFNQRYFYDSVHMNAFGGLKFFDKLVEAIAADSRAASAVIAAGRELERHSALASAGRRRTY